ncbi:IS256 family transposase [Trichlorobacter lovleyi]|uniref:Mutator family transposase n=1 Tax=Trichlorobacter lovleyi (strain ATCC BAA-1151 / DSM 17278 / SZ) TaxID=398767 RepID=B3E250_TRIL1|nr:IS256 family transposase [Trichlorobacter lovleyi]ACD95974.1 transposase mutator type [Trichlorobacter lovleyi SZ]ACD97153.1 transposase mutator type [Trichlorobacter lovleyi SZ]
MDDHSTKKAQIIQLNESAVRDHLGEMVRNTVEDTLNSMLDSEADRLCNAEKYQRHDARTDTRAGHYQRKLMTKAGEVNLNIPKLRRQTFETAIIERYRRREASVEESLIEMYLAGVSVRRIEDITETLWGTKVSPGTISNLNKKVYAKIEEWRNRPIIGNHPYVYLDGIVLKRSWGGEVCNVSVLVAIGVNEYGYRKILGVCEGAKEDKAGWSSFLHHLKQRGLSGVRLFITDACMGLVESLAEYYPESKWQRCIVHFYRNVFSVVPRKKMPEVAAMLKAIHASEDKQAAIEKAGTVFTKLEEMKLREAAKKVQDSISETLTYFDFPREHRIRIRTNNALERIMKEIRRRTRVVGAFPDGHSALMLCAARLRHIAGTQWGSKRYLNIDLLKEQELELQLQINEAA